MTMPTTTTTTLLDSLRLELPSTTNKPESIRSQSLIPPREFLPVAPGIYASCLPHAQAIPFLKNLGVRSAVFFCPKQHPLNLELPQEVREWILNIEQHKWLQIERTKNYGRIAITQAAVKAALEYLLIAPKPLLLSGYDHVETCGLVVACLRKLQCWDMSSIQDELSRAVSVSLDAVHLRFVNQFCASLPPTYLLGYPLHVQRSFEHLDDTSESSHLVLQLPPLSQIPSWLWFGCTSPAELLGYANATLSTSGETFHPTMHIRIEAEEASAIESLSACNAEIEADEHEHLPTPRCTSLQVSPERPKQR